LPAGDELAVVALLLEAGADAGATNHHGVTVLLSGAEGGHAGVVQLLLAKGVDVHARTRGDQTPEDLAWALGHAEVALKPYTLNPKT
jgi:ankyrin repeat protein